MIKQYGTGLVFLMFFMCCVGCQDEDAEPYPSVVTEFAELHANEDGVIYQIRTDDGTVYSLTNVLRGYRPSQIYRGVCGFTIQEHDATLYQLTPVNMLHDSTSVAVYDPTDVVSIWRRGAYLNVHLRPKSGSDKPHYWGYSLDGSGSNCIRIRLHHAQNGDPAYYSRQEYASLYVPELENCHAEDTLQITVNTYEGWCMWSFPDRLSQYTQ